MLLVDLCCFNSELIMSRYESVSIQSVSEVTGTYLKKMTEDLLVNSYFLSVIRLEICPRF